MTIKHQADGAEVNGVVFDTGELLLVCSGCEQAWTDSLVPMAAASAALRSNLREYLASHAEVLDQLGVGHVRGLDG